MEGAEEFRARLDQVGKEAAETERRTDALDGFEFLTMAEAAELGHWEIVKTMGDTLGDEQVSKLAGWAAGVQRKHIDQVRDSSLELAADEVRG